MELPEDKIRESLQKNMQRIEDESFTEDVVRIHLERKAQREPRPFFNFASLLTGIALLLTSIVISLLILTENFRIPGLELTPRDGLILLTLSLLFVLFTWLDDIFLQKRVKLG